MALATDVGLVRAENQDRAAVLRIRRPNENGTVIAVVCDGMGGMESGAECASKALASFLFHCMNSIEPTELMLKNAVLEANKTVYSDHGGRGGATLSAACLDGKGTLTGVNVGDSRIYCFTNSGLSRISADDTLAGQFGSENEVFSGRNELLQHVGIGKDIEPHILPIESFEGADARLLLTSDGVHFMDEGLMASIIQHANEPAKAAQRLTELSKWLGGKDNATTILSSSYNQLIEFRDESRPGIVEVWDSFGELQLHIPQYIPQFKSPKNSVAAKDSPSPELVQSKNEKPENESKATSNPKKRRKSRAKASGKKDVEGDNGDVESPPKEIPQLNIKFDSSQGE
ncbi:MAG: protein phosphatase 2C domain-containing protein [Halopseudomonas sp.]